MSIYDELQKLGYAFDHEYGDSEERMEVWVNRKAGTGVMIEWFNMPEVQGYEQQFATTVNVLNTVLWDSYCNL